MKIVCTYALKVGPLQHELTLSVSWVANPQKLGAKASNP